MKVESLGFSRCDVTVMVASKDTLRACAAMMSSSSPWSEFGYSEAECLAKLELDMLDIRVAMANQEVIGFIALQPNGFGSFPMLSLVCIRDDVRNLGVGTYLISIVEEEVFKTGKNLFLTVSDFNVDAIRLYRKLGFVQCGEITNYNFHGQSELLMRKTTGPKRESFKRGC